MEINIHQAKTNLSKLLERAALGEEITICKAGKPIAHLIPARQSGKPRKLGTAKGDFVVPADFDAPLPEDVLCAFEP